MVNSTPNFGCTFSQNWNVNWGNPRAFPFPQIYQTAQPSQWQLMSRWSIDNTNMDAMNFYGAATQQAACSTNLSDPICIGTFSPQGGWDTFFNEILRDAGTGTAFMKWSTDFTWAN